MANFRRIPSFFASCWAIIVSISFDHLFIGHIRHVIRRAADYVVKATASHLVTTPIAEWRIIERMCSRSIRVKINIFGNHPRGVGALNSPLLS